LATKDVTHPHSSRSSSGELKKGDEFSKWMRAAQAGDQDSYRLLLDRVGPMLLRYLRRRVFDSSAVEDISQEVLLTMHRVLHTYDPARAFEPWFFSIARSRLIDYMRRVKRIGANEFTTDEVPDVADESEAGLANWEQFLEILEGLPASQREAFCMLKIEGLTTVEAARRAGVSVSALKVRAHRAYGRLKDGLSEEVGE
jgi:RNA polymerase sigma-70 factor (ECF subfamily)